MLYRHTAQSLRLINATLTYRPRANPRQFWRQYLILPYFFLSLSNLTGDRLEEITKKRSQSRLLFFLMATDYNPKYLRMS